MAPSIIYNNVVKGEIFLPGQIFVFGGFALRANLLVHLEQIDSYAPGHQVRFGSLNFVADIRGDLIFDGFEPMTAVPGHHDEHDLDLSSGSAREIALVSALVLEPERTASSEDGKLNPATEAADSAALEPHTDPTSGWACVTGTSDSSPAMGSGPCAPASIDPDWAPVLEFSSADIFQHWPFGDVLNSLKSLSLSGDSWPNYVRLEWDADDEEIRSPPPTTSPLSTT